MVRFLVIDRTPPVSLMVCGPDGRANWMVSLLPRVPLTWAFSVVDSDRPSVPLTTATASRRVRALSEVVLSAVLLTVSTAGARRSSSASRIGRNGRNGLRNIEVPQRAPRRVGVGTTPAWAGVRCPELRGHRRRRRPFHAGGRGSPAPTKVTHRAEDVVTL